MSVRDTLTSVSMATQGVSSMMQEEGGGKGVLLYKWLRRFLMMDSRADPFSAAAAGQGRVKGTEAQLECSGGFRGRAASFAFSIGSVGPEACGGDGGNGARPGRAGGAVR